MPRLNQVSAASQSITVPTELITASSKNNNPQEKSPAKKLADCHSITLSNVLFASSAVKFLHGSPFLYQLFGGDDPALFSIYFLTSARDGFDHLKNPTRVCHLRPSKIRHVG